LYCVFIFRPVVGPWYVHYVKKGLELVSSVV
jgi:hypothetical protein